MTGRARGLAQGRGADRAFAIGLARAFGGALFFALPLLMTMEMWWLGFHMRPARLALFLVAFIPVVIGLSHYAGFEETHGWGEDVRDGFVALAVGFVTAAAMLALLGMLERGMPLDEMVGKITLQAVPASVGAALAGSQLGGHGAEEPQAREREEISYAGELFLMGVGAIFLAFNLAPTDEMVLLATHMSDWQIIGAALLSLLTMHAFVYAVEFRGQEALPEGSSPWRAFVYFTVVGYAIALLISAYILWTFGRYDGSGAEFRVATAIVLGFPASLGAAAARLVL